VQAIVDTEILGFRTPAGCCEGALDVLDGKAGRFVSNGDRQLNSLNYHGGLCTIPEYPSAERETRDIDK